MTYIEFFDRVSVENICACLTHIPDRVVFIGENSKRMKKAIKNYSRVFEDRGHNIEFVFKTMTKSNLQNIVELLSELVKEYDDCIFDITGGDELATLALGIVCSMYPQKNIKIHRINLRNNVVYDIDEDGETIYSEPIELSVAENIRIYGGEIVYGDVTEEKTCEWELDDEFLNDVDLMWYICRMDVRNWNLQTAIFGAAEKVGELCDDGLTTIAKRSDIERYLSRYKMKYNKFKRIVEMLGNSGLLTHFDDENIDDTLTVTYKNDQVKKCLILAGRALEMKVFTLCVKLVDDEGAPVYNDVATGVLIDWDGELHDDEAEGECDTENEVDIVLMRGTIPVFISCKNGKVTADELYKLNTVAERFGGTYAKKVLVTTALSNMGDAAEYLRRRALDMNIRILEDVQDMDDIDLEKALRNLWCC